MPELPEVEALRRSLWPWIEGRQVRKVKVSLPKLVSAKGTTRAGDKNKVEEFVSGIEDRQIVGLDRRSKNLIFRLSDEGRVLVHLKMSGQLVFRPTVGGEGVVWGGHPIELSERELPNKHTHVIFSLSNGTLYYNDVRQFGYLLYYANEVEFSQANHFERLGLEPLSTEFSLDKFRTVLQQRKGVLKKVFLEQRVVVGLGNIYADEVCFVAKIRPDRRVESLSDEEIDSLYEAIKTILPQAVEDGGSSVANYLLADGSRGNYAKKHLVYNRGGLPCKICGNVLQKVQLAGRTTVYCSECQG